MAHTFGSDAQGFGSLSGWAIQSSTRVAEKKRANVLGPTGNEAASNLWDETYRYTTTYKATTTAAPTVPANIGADVNSIMLEGIALSTQTDDYVSMTLTGHVHVDGTHGTVRSVAHGITLTAGFGVSLFGCTVAETNGGFSSSCNIGTQHLDVPGGVAGNTIAGENFDPRIDIDLVAHGDATIASGFDQTTKTTERVNVDFLKTSLSGTKALAFA